jgi:hypothetical protein
VRGAASISSAAIIPKIAVASQGELAAVDGLNTPKAHALTLF